MRSESLRVALGPVDPAGTARATATGLRQLGVDARLVLSVPTPHLPRTGRVLGRARRSAFALTAPFAHDVLHYQSFPWLPRAVEGRWARQLGRSLVITFHGDDCRQYGVARRLYPSRGRAGDPSRDPAVEARVRLLAGRCHGAVVADYELATYVLPHFRRVYVLPLAVEEPTLPSVQPNPVPLVLHAPSDPALKGTAAIEDAVAEAARSVPLEFRLLTGVAHSEVLATLARADVVIDQLDSATAGVFALEAMYARKPVLCEVQRDALPPYQNDLPIVAVTGETLAGELVELISDDRRRRELGDDGAAYVQRHRPDRVAQALLHVYRHARTDAAGLFEATSAGIRALDEAERALRERLEAVREDIGTISRR